jgi:hypothetical protein
MSEMPGVFWTYEMTLLAYYGLAQPAAKAFVTAASALAVALCSRILLPEYAPMELERIFLQASGAALYK